MVLSGEYRCRLDFSTFNLSVVACRQVSYFIAALVLALNNKCGEMLIPNRRRKYAFPNDSYKYDDLTALMMVLMKLVWLSHAVSHAMKVGKNGKWHAR